MKIGDIVYLSHKFDRNAPKDMWERWLNDEEIKDGIAYQILDLYVLANSFGVLKVYGTINNLWLLRDHFMVRKPKTSGIIIDMDF